MDLSNAACAIILGTDAIESYKATDRARIDLSLRDFEISKSNEHVFLELDGEGEIDRIVFASWHPEHWSYSAGTLHDMEVTYAIDLIWNAAAAMIGVADVDNQMLVAQDNEIQGHDPCVAMRRRHQLGRLRHGARSMHPSNASVRAHAEIHHLR